MGKVVNVPEGHNYVIGISKIGDISNITPNSFEISNITIDKITEVLGIKTNSLAEVCKSNQINQNALFRPSGQPPYRLGDFAGYNHIAKPATHFYADSSTNVGGMWNVGNYKDIAVLISRGERKSTVANNHPDGAWGFIRVEITLNDTLNNETLTGYSPVQAVNQTGFTNFIVRINSDNVDRQGVMHVKAYYMHWDGVTTLAQIEDTHISKSFTIQQRAVYIGWQDCTVQYDGGIAYYSDSGGNLTAFGAWSLRTNNRDNAQFASPTLTPSPPDFPQLDGRAFTNVVYLQWDYYWYRCVLRKRVAGEYFNGYKVREDEGNTLLYEITSYSIRYSLPTHINNL